MSPAENIDTAALVAAIVDALPDPELVKMLTGYGFPAELLESIAAERVAVLEPPPPNVIHLAAKRRPRW